MSNDILTFSATLVVVALASIALMRRLTATVDHHTDDSEPMVEEAQTRKEELLHARVPDVGNDATTTSHPDNWTQCIISPHVRDTILKSPGFPQPIPRPKNQNKAYRISQSRGKGLGMFATRDIAVGELILAERPLLVCPVRGYYYGPVSEAKEDMERAMLKQWSDMLDSVGGRMAPQNKQALLSLYNYHTNDGSSVIAGVVRTNGFGVGEALSDPGTNRGKYTSLYKTFSRMNHSCSPNVTRIWDTASFSMSIRATRPIRKNEEIFTLYCNVAQPYATRQSALSLYGVKCDCHSCTLPMKQRRRSDIQRENIFACVRPSSVDYETRKWLGRSWLWLQFGDGGYFRTLELWVRTVEDEGLEHVAGYLVALKALVCAYRAMEDYQNAELWRRRLIGMLKAHTHQELSEAQAEDLLAKEVQRIRNLR